MKSMMMAMLAAGVVVVVDEIEKEFSRGLGPNHNSGVSAKGFAEALAAGKPKYERKAPTQRMEMEQTPPELNPTGLVPTGYETRIGHDEIMAKKINGGMWRAYIVSIPMSTTPNNAVTKEKLEVIRDGSGAIVNQPTLGKLTDALRAMPSMTLSANRSLSVPTKAFKWEPPQGVVDDYLDYLEDTEITWPLEPKFDLKNVRLADLERAKIRPLRLSGIRLKELVRRTRTKGPIVLDADFSVVDGMHRIADAVNTGKHTIAALVRRVDYDIILSWGRNDETEVDGTQIFSSVQLAKLFMALEFPETTETERNMLLDFSDADENKFTDPDDETQMHGWLKAERKERI